MSRIVSLLLFLAMLLPCIFILTACNGGEEPPQPPSGNPSEDKAPALYLPAAGSFIGHSTENFDTFVYTAPSIETLTSAFSLAAQKLCAEETDYALALSTVEAVEGIFESYTQMLAYAQIRFFENQEDAYFAGEYKRLYEASPKVCLAMEGFFCAAAASNHGEALANTDYFPDDLLSRYQGDGIYTEQTLPLFEQEAQILLEAKCISADTVQITFNNRTDTLTAILRELASIYGKNSGTYQQLALRCEMLYTKEANSKRSSLYLRLLSVRREIADTLGYESYAHLAVQRLGYDAKTEDMTEALATVETHIIPLYRALSSTGFFNADTAKVEKIRYPEAMLNTLTAFYEAKGGKLFEGYNYLLQKGLFSLGEAADGRATASYGTFLAKRLQPFLFISAGGSAADYLSAAGALGDALYYYYNGEEDTAFANEMRMAELSNALHLSLRLLTLEGMEEALSKTESTMEISSYLVLLKREVYSLIQTMLTQSMRTEIELAVYALESGEINENAVNAIVKRAAERFGCYEMQGGSFTGLTLATEGLLSPAMFEAPMQSFGDITSVYVACSLFLMENKASGAGFTALEALLATDLRGGKFSSVLSSLSLLHPAEEDTARTLVSTLFEALTGYSYEANPPLPPSIT